MEPIRLCPCCRKQIAGRVDNPKLRQGAKIGTKFAMKQGVKLVASTTIPNATAATGAAIGSVIPVVGNFLGYVAGYAVGHVMQEVALDSAYNSLEKKYATRKYFFNCPECNLTWDSNETDDRAIVLRNFVDYYNANTIPKPLRPRPFRFKNHKIASWGLYGGIFLSISPFFMDMNSGDAVQMSIIGFLVAVVFGIRLYVEYIKCKELYNQYKVELKAAGTFNNALHKDLIEKCNQVITNYSPRLGNVISVLPGCRFYEFEEENNLDKHATTTRTIR